MDHPSRSLPSASIIVRTKDEAANIVRTLTLLRRQTAPAEIVLVDSGSTDGTVELARPHIDRLVELEAAAYRPGLALNLGADAASGEIHAAFSAHCTPPDDGWLERSLAYYAHADVVATNGSTGGPDGQPLDGPFFQGAAELTTPLWGFSNHASTWRAAVWREHRFDEAVPTAEDRKWSWEVIRAGGRIVFDPALEVSMAHRWRAGTVAYFRRTRNEQYWVQTTAPVAPLSVRDAVVQWWAKTPDDHRSRTFHRLNPRRVAEIAGTWAGRRRTPPE
jgi:rhamnosyltransferase